MSYTKENEEDDDGEAAVFIEDTYSSDGEGVIELRDQKYQSSCKRLSRESSPPLLLAFTSGRAPLGSSSPSPASSTALQEEEEEGGEDSEQPVEEWMILGGEEQVGDSSIQLNLGYWSSSEEDSGDEDPKVKSVNDIWAVSEKDKSLSSRYFVTGRSLICHMCNRTGHLAKSCYYQKKCPTCILCGVKGHIQRDCPSRPCPSCSLPSHGLRPCEKPPVWNQHCQRCGMTGHLSDACPDTWRQYHLTIRLEVPLRPRTVHRIKHKRCLAHCYNCSKRGHYGYECTKRRMVSGTFPSLPYVCHYDTINDILQCCTRMHGKKAKGGFISPPWFRTGLVRVVNVNQKSEGLVSAGSMGTSDQQHLSDQTRESGEENQPIQGRSRTKQETCRRAGRRKTWPERRRERQEMKRLRREAQARREGGLLGRSQGNSDDEARHADSLKSPFHCHWQSTPSPQKKKKKKKEEAGIRRSRKSREAERWKKRGGIKHGDLYPHGDIDKRSENLLSPKQRVRHRRR